MGLQAAIEDDDGIDPDDEGEPDDHDAYVHVPAGGEGSPLAVRGD